MELVIVFGSLVVVILTDSDHDPREQQAARLDPDGRVRNIDRHRVIPRQVGLTFVVKVASYTEAANNTARGFARIWSVTDSKHDLGSVYSSVSSPSRSTNSQRVVPSHFDAGG